MDTGLAQAWLLLDPEDPAAGALPFGGRDLGLSEEEIDGAYAGYLPIFETETLARQHAARLGGVFRIVRRQGQALEEAIASEDWDAYAVVVYGPEGHRIVEPGHEESEVAPWTGPLPTPDPLVAAQTARIADAFMVEARRLMKIRERLVAAIDEAIDGGTTVRLPDETFALAGRSRVPILADIMLAVDPVVSDPWSGAIGNPTIIVDLYGPDGIVAKGRLAELRKLKSLRRYVVVFSDDRHVEHYVSNGNAWQLTRTGDFVIPEINLE